MMPHIFDPPIDVPSAPRKSDDVRAGFKRKWQATFDHPHASNEHEQQTEDDDSETESEDEDPAELSIDDEDPPSKGRVITKQRNLKQQHFHLLSAILHRCLLDHDYKRASKAFGLLLRYELSGTRIDLRKKGLWGIGAELQLRKHPPASHDELVDQQTDIAEQSRILPFTEEGFEAARRYYDRLILQYSSKRYRAQPVNGQTFYLAAYTIWIFQVQTRRQRADLEVERNEEQTLNGLTGGLDPEGGDDESRAPIAASKRPHRESELQEARIILDRLSDLTQSPPLDRDATLLRLQARIEYWIADLIELTSDMTSNDAPLHLAESRSLYQRALNLGAPLLDEEVQMLKRPSKDSSQAESATSE